MNPANTKTTRTQSKAPEHHIKILDSVKGIMSPSLNRLKSISWESRFIITSPGCEVNLGLHGKECESKNYCTSHSNSNQDLYSVVCWTNSTYRKNSIRNRHFDYHLSASPHTQWRVPGRSCCEEFSFWWIPRKRGQASGWWRRPWQRREFQGVPRRILSLMGWRRTQWRPWWR